MKTLAALCILALGLTTAACSKKVSTDDLAKLKSEACACRDKRCGDKVEKKMMSLLDGVKETDLDKEGINLTMEVALCVASAQAGISNN